jgi:hypothetical protein
MTMMPDFAEDSYLEAAYEDLFRVEDDDWETREEDFDDIEDHEW